MPLQRHFLGWDGPLTARVRDFLLPGDLSGPIDLEKDLVIVPTRQAGRRLRESVAQVCAEHDTAALSLRVEDPAFFVRSDGEPCSVGIKAIWADTLLAVDLRKYAALFPAGAADRDPGWALGAGEMIQRLRSTLADGGYRIADVPAACGNSLDEPERWQCLARLEAAYLDRAREAGLDDPCIAKIARAGDPQIPDGIERIVVAAVPDPSLLMIRALERLAGSLPLDILVHAPESLADHFDEWGRPDPEKWRDAAIDIPDPDRNILLASSPISQSRLALEQVAVENERFGPADIAIGVPDRSVIPFLEADLSDSGLPAFDPANRLLKEHPFYGLLQAWCGVMTGARYVSVSELLRHPDFLDFLGSAHELSAANILAELDAFQDRHLPLTLDDLTGRLARKAATKGKTSPQSDALARAVAVISEQVRAFAKADPADAVRGFLQAVYDVRKVDERSPEYDELKKVSDRIDEVLRAFSREPLKERRMDKPFALGLLIRTLGEQEYYHEREDAVIDLEGWLELAWNDAPLLIVTGVNEEFVPGSRLSDVFLPDSLRRRLKLRDDAWRLARDAFLMRSLVESHRKTGRVCWIAGKTSTAGEPLKPSRLFFRCGDNELPARAARLFGDAPERKEDHPVTVSFPLDPRPTPDADAKELERLHVTAFRDYLACPFRFYLKHVMGMESVNAEKREPDALDFGNMVHAAFQAMADDADMQSCDDEDRLASFLGDSAAAWARLRFGSSPSLAVRIVLDGASQRLAAAARVQAQLIRDGWRILRAEEKYKTCIKGLTVQGMIDRIDRNEKTGEIRIIDYKSSDTEATPEKAHLARSYPETPDYAQVAPGRKQKRWIDLQLPLYRALIADEKALGQGEVQLAYFNLPKAISSTGVSTWDAFSDELLQSAITCAEKVAECIRARVFWPPAEKLQRDDFESLFHGTPEECFRNPEPAHK